MNAILKLVRPEIRNLRPYRAAEFKDGMVRLNANETPWRPSGDESTTGLNLYPDSRPLALTDRLARHYDLEVDQLLVTRGSSEAIDLLVRCFCREGQDDIVICPPTFGMYEVYAHIQGADVVEVPLLAEDGFALNMDAISSAWNERCKLLFICSPNNPTGNRVPTTQIHELCERFKDRGLVVVDAAYAEFADQDPTLELLEQHDNVAILRTLSKAFGLAGVRCGAVLASAPIVDMLNRILPPYSYPAPSQEAALASLSPESRDELDSRAKTLRDERERLAENLNSLAGVVRTWPSEANFLLLEVSDPRGFVKAAAIGGVLIRDFSWDPYLENCVRITVGTTEQNNQLLEALQ